jgi:hypothetical protein
MAAEGVAEVQVSEDAGVVRSVPGSGCTVFWSPDGTVVEKHYRGLRWVVGDHPHRAFERERRVGRLLVRHPPPVPHARLLGADHGRRILRFEAVDGEPLGPKFPLEAAPGDVADLIRLASGLGAGGYRPPAPWLRRFDLARRLGRGVASGALAPSVAARVRQQAVDAPPVLVFGHGDITARNGLRERATGRAVLIDWEWAGRYPRPWDLAFLWFSLVDLPGGPAKVEAAVPAADVAWFWRSALLVQVLHLTLWGLRPGTPFRPKHERRRDELVERVLALA